MKRPRGEPSDAAKIGDEESDTTDAGENRGFPSRLAPMLKSQSVVATGMLFCLRCKAPQTDDSQGDKTLLREHEAPQANLGNSSDRC